jgi:hypothetical protein
LYNLRADNQLVHQDWVGKWDPIAEFWSDASKLRRVAATVRKIRGPEAGTLELEGGLQAFFVPGRAGAMKGLAENQVVSCLVGFSYDGIRAWSVEA